MGYTAAPLEKLIEQFSQFPGIGRKGATRMAYQVLSMSDADAAALAEAIQTPTPGSTAAASVRTTPRPSSAPSVPAPSGTAPPSAWSRRPAMCRPLSAPGSTTACIMSSTASSAHGRHRCRTALGEGAAGPAGQRRGERGHHAMNPPSRARPQPCIWQSSSSLWHQDHPSGLRPARGRQPRVHR